MWWQWTKLVACWTCVLVALFVLAAWPFSLGTATSGGLRKVRTFPPHDDPAMVGTRTLVAKILWQGHIEQTEGRIRFVLFWNSDEDDVAAPAFEHWEPIADRGQPPPDAWPLGAFHAVPGVERAGFTMWGLELPHWFLAAALLAWPAWRWRRRRKQGGRGFPVEVTSPAPAHDATGRT